MLTITLKLNIQKLRYALVLPMARRTMKIIKILALFILILSSSHLNATEKLEKVSLQLQWVDQFQFAGYYMAKEKGFYADAGLDVELLKFDNRKDPLTQVIQKKATYGVGRSSLIINKANGHNIHLLAAIFQSSPLVILARKDSNISKIEDFTNKRIMSTDDASLVVSLNAMINHQGHDAKEMVHLNHSFDIEDLIQNRTDLMASYISNEPFLLNERGVAYTVFDPKDYGFDFYSDILFTSDYEIQKHPLRTEKFTEASIRGWEYAFSHIDETVEVIIKHYNTQNKSREALTFEGHKLKSLAYYKTDTLGKIDANKIQRIYDIYNVMGFVENKIDIQSFIFKVNYNWLQTLNQKETRYLKDKKEFKICVLPDFLPISSIQEHKFIGISADYMQLVEEILDVKFTLLPTQSWKESLENIKHRRCDILPVAQKTPSREKYLSFTNSIYNFPLVIATTLEKNYVSELSTLSEKKVGIVRGFSAYELFKIKYPNINFIEVNNHEDGLNKVLKGELYGFVGSLSSIGYKLQKNYANMLKINAHIGKPLHLGMGVRNDDHLLLSVLNKAISSINEERKQEVFHRWINVKYENPKDYTLLIEVTALFGFILLLIFFFIFKQNQLKKELNRSKETIQEYLDLTPDGFAVADIESKKIVFCNKAYEEMTGYTLEELADKTLMDIHPKESLPYVLHQFECLAKEEFNIALNIPFLHKNGSIKLYDANAHIMKRKNSTYNVASFRDVSEKVEMQKILQKTNNELEAHKENLEQKVQQALETNRKQDEQLQQQSRLAQMGEMISMIAHQWRQPLGAISTTAVNLEMKLELESFDLETKEGREEAISYFLQRLKSINGFVQNMTTTIDDFRNFYKPDKASVVLSLDLIIEKSLKIIQASLENDNIELIKAYHSTQKMKVYDSELMQVVLNLLKNAQDNFKDKKTKYPQITLKTEDNSFSICDNGGGISENILPEIFDPYFSTKDEKNGTGLGLYMSKTIIEEHHKGSLEATNIDNGVCFKVTIKGDVL